MLTKKASAEAKEKTNRTKKRLGLRKKAFKKFTGMALRNEIGVTEVERNN